jgi:hypothetical protein
VAVCVGEFGLAVKRWQRGAEHKKEPKAFPLRKLPHSDFVIIYKKRERDAALLPQQINLPLIFIIYQRGELLHAVIFRAREMDKFIL